MSLKERLEEAIPGLHVDSAGGACPFQLDGDVQGERVYFRFRHDEATLYVWPDGEERWEACRLYAEQQDVTGQPHAGVLSEDEAFELFTRLWADLRPRASFQSTSIERTAALVQTYVEALRAADDSSGGGADPS